MLVSTMLSNQDGDVGVIAPEASVEEFCRKVRELRVGALVVSNDGETILGIVSERDVMRAIAAKGPSALSGQISGIMTKDVVSCSPKDAIGDLMIMMTRNLVRHIPVTVDEKMVGLISIVDVVKSRVDELERDTEAMQEYIKTG